MSFRNMEAYENYDIEAIDRVLKCANLPHKHGTATTLKSLKQALTRMKHKTFDPVHGGYHVEYQQDDDYGRAYETSPSLQFLQTDVRKYIIKSLDTPLVDIDMESAHANILANMFEENGIRIPAMLRAFIQDRNSALVKYGLSEKREFAVIMNNEVLPPGCHSGIVKLHALIYGGQVDTAKYEGLLPILCKKNVDFVEMLKKKIVADKKKKHKEVRNVGGSLMARFIQNIEHRILMESISFASKRGVVIRSWIFDGFMVDQSPVLDDQFLVDLNKHILDKLKYKIKFAYKSTLTEWEPIPDEEAASSVKFSKERATELLEAAYSGEGKDRVKDPNVLAEFIEYMNQYLFVVDEPHMYYSRKRTNALFVKHNSINCRERHGRILFEEWNNSDLQKEYHRVDFIIDYPNESLPDVFNMFERKPFDPDVDYNVPLKERMPLLYEYITEIVCGEAASVDPTKTDFRQYLIHFTFDWLSYMYKYGKTQTCLVFLGAKGAGKSFFGETLVENIFGKREYCRIVNDIMSINDKFNSQSEHNIVTIIEEVSSTAAQYHSIQNKLKDLVTAQTVDLQKKFVDAYRVKSNSNYIVCTNYDNPIAITDDNRRFQPYRFSNARRRDHQFYALLKKEIKTNILYLRGWLLARPVSKEYRPAIRDDSVLIKDMAQANRSSFQTFIEDRLAQVCSDIISDQNPHISGDMIYNEYKTFQQTYGLKAVPWSTLRSAINNTINCQYKVVRVKTGRQMDDVVVVNPAYIE